MIKILNPNRSILFRTANCILLITYCLLPIACFLLPAFSSAQCCSPGNPIGGTGALGVLDKQSTKIFLYYKYGYSGRYFEGSKPAESQSIKNGNYNYTGISLAFGIAEKITTEIETGYFINKTQNYAENIFPNQQIGKGLTDITLGFKVNFYRNLEKQLEITSGVGIKFPIGSNKQTYQKAVLPQDLQPTTGSTDFIHTLFLYKGYVEKHLHFFINNRIEFKRQNPEAYKYGNLYATSFFTSYSLSPGWNIITAIRSEIRAMDTSPTKDNGREKVLPSGSQKIFIVPQLSYSFGKDWILSVLVDIPVYQYYNDKQLASTVAVSLSISKEFKRKFND
ncbi:MAG: transporter [Bacteroidetes bacterium]|nr:transporter [Bacteroidota bacterium]